MIAEASNSKLVGITEITKSYLPISRKRGRKFVHLYLDIKRIGNRIFVEHDKPESLLCDPERELSPLNVLGNKPASAYYLKKEIYMIILI